MRLGDILVSRGLASIDDIEAALQRQLTEGGRLGDNLIESAITRRSTDELKLKKGDTVTAVVKATEVMIQKD